MKKLLLSAVVLAALGNSAFAQLNENFNNGIPSTWKRYNVDGLTPAAQVAFVNDAWVARQKLQASTTDSCIVSTSWYTPAGIANDWIVSPPFMVNGPNILLRFEELGYDPAYPDGYEVRVFTGTDSLPSQNSTVIYTSAGADNAWNYKGASLGAYNGQTIRVAFRNNSNDRFLLGLDNISTIAASNQNDISVDSVIVDAIVGNSAIVKVLVKNQGYANITSATLDLVLDNGTPVSETFSGLNMGPLSSKVLTFTAPLNLTSVASGAHTVKVTAMQVNGVVDPTTADNEKMQGFIRASGTVTRAGLIEEFTSSTCVPCANFNRTFDPLIVSNNANTPAANFNVIKYQMNWPSPGTDPSYNNDGTTRRGFYGVTGIPDHYTNGMPGANGNQAEINASKTEPAYVAIGNASYKVKADSMMIDFSITPMYTLASASDYRVFAAVVERQYNYTGTTTQTNFVYVMRKMFPDGNGATVTSFNDGVANNYSFNYKFNVGGVAQGNNNLWGNAANTDLVVFVQNINTGAVLQSASFPAQVAQGVTNTLANGTSIALYPNPASGIAYVNFNSDKGGDVNILVTDAVGRVVLTQNASIQAGRDAVEIATDRIPAGLYNVSVKMNGEVVTQRLSVVK